MRDRVHTLWRVRDARREKLDHRLDIVLPKNNRSRNPRIGERESCEKRRIIEGGVGCGDNLTLSLLGALKIISPPPQSFHNVTGTTTTTSTSAMGCVDELSDATSVKGCI